MPPSQSGAVASVVSPVEEGVGDGVALDVFVDWRTATGTTSTAVLDGSKLVDRFGGTSGLIEVITNPGTLGFPATLTNIMQVEFNAENSALVGREPSDGYLHSTVPSVGNSIYRRWYLRNDLPNGANTGQDHGCQTQVGVIELCFRWGGGGTGTFLYEIQSNSTGGHPSHGFGVQLDRGKCYRIEHIMTRTGTSTATCAVNIYDESVSLTVPVFDSTDFLDTWEDNGGADLTAQTFSFTSTTDAFRAWLFGVSGQGGATYTGGTCYLGGYAASYEGPIGVYPCPGSGEDA
jgi:hypothetical protein